MRLRFVLAVVLLAGGLGACVRTGGESRTVLVDASSDEFAGVFRAYFPRDVSVRPGMSIKFHQVWSGEPHTVTLGTVLQDLVEPEMLPVILDSTEREPSDENLSPEVGAAVGAFFETMPHFYGEKGINQGVAQPCSLTKGVPAQGPKPCPTTDLKPFTGRESYYSSGFIPYLGDNGNDWEMEIADDADPGTYFYYCALHGPGMSGQIKIVDDGDDIASQSALNRKADAEKKRIELPLAKQLEKEQAGDGDFKGNLAGSGTESLLGLKGAVNEFTPRTVRAKVGEPVTWTFILPHTISFNVPPYVPYYEVRSSGTVVESEAIYKARGGWPGRPTPIEVFGEGPPLPSESADAGSFDGSGGLKSSGTDWQTGDTYTVTFTKAGTYPMACLVHPGMIGKVVVS